MLMASAETAGQNGHGSIGKSARLSHAADKKEQAAG